MSENALTTFGAGADIPFSPAAIAPPKRKSSGKFLPTLKFLANDECKEVKAGKAEAGHWCLVAGDQVTDLGESIVGIPFVRLDKAMDNNPKDGAIVAYGAETEEYGRIADEVDADGYNSGCMHGPIFCIYLVDVEDFVQCWLYSKSARNEGDNISLFLPVAKEHATEECPARAAAPMTLGAREVTSTPAKKDGSKGNKEFTYNVPTTVAFEGELEVENPPTPEELVAVCNKFVEQSVVEDESRER